MKLKITFHDDRIIPVFLRTIANWTTYTDVTFKENKEQDGYSFVIEFDDSKVKGFNSYLTLLEHKGVKITKA